MKTTTKKELLDKINYLEQSLKDLRERHARFNKYAFLRDLEETVTNEIENGNIEDEDGLRQYIDSDIENACIYYSDCFDICKELNATTFNDTEFGEATDICKLAVYSLMEFVYGELDTDEFEHKLMDKKLED